MILTIDTENKVVTIKGSFTLEQLHNTLIDLGIEDYTITVKKEIQYIPTITHIPEIPKYPWEQTPVVYDTCNTK